MSAQVRHDSDISLDRRNREKEMLDVTCEGEPQVRKVSQGSCRTIGWIMTPSTEIRKPGE